MKNHYKVRQELRPSRLKDISDEQIAQHWELYEGYVKNVNALNEKIAVLAQKGQFESEFAELKRRLGFEYDGMILHEHYFSVLERGNPEPRENGGFLRLIKKCFGTFEAWREEFTGVAKIRGQGWAILYYDPQYKVLNNHWISSHEEGHPAGFIPILVLDVWEHAYMVDWEADGRADYIETFFRNIDWSKVERYLEEAERAFRPGPAGVAHNHHQ